MEWLAPSPWRFVLLIGLLSGTALCFVVPPFMVADEPAHFFRSYEISEGELLSTKKPDGTGCGRNLPASLGAIVSLQGNMPFHPEVKFDPNTLWKALKIKLEPTERTFLSFVNTGLYSPVPYLPQALGIAVGRSLKYGPVALVYWGRVANLIVSMCILALSTWVVPRQRWTFALAALLPMTLFQCASLSADAITISVSYLFIALVLRLTLSREQLLSKFYSFALLLVGVALSLSKTTYTPLLALVFIVPSHKFGRGLSSKLAVSGVIVFTGLAAAAGWALLVRELYVPGVDGVKPPAQVAYVVAHPSEFLAALWESCQIYGNFYFNSMAGQLLGWLDTKIPYSMLRPTILCIVFSAALEFADGDTPSLWSRLFGLTIWLFTVVLTALMMYLTWNKVGATRIEGIQGRYFLPILPLVLLSIDTKLANNFGRFGRYSTIIYAACGIYSACLTLFFVVQRYYQF